MQLLTVNVGSSSLKLALFEVNADNFAELLAKAEMSAVGQTDPTSASNHLEALEMAIQQLQTTSSLEGIEAVGYRVVFGGPDLQASQLITPQVLQDLGRYADFDADHMPYVLEVIKALQTRFAQARHVACFDSAFFADLPHVAQLLPIPRKYYAAGIRKFGYHGLSYDYLLSALRDLPEPAANGKVVMAHLGSGASLAGIVAGRPVDTTMSLTPSSGIPMSSRSGDLDPSVAQYLMSVEGLTIDQYADLINHQSGLLGISETTADMYQLLQNQTDDERAADAIACFCYNTRKAIGSLSAAMGGLDLLVFSGGIGERSAEIRSRICHNLGFLNIELDNESNQNNGALISKNGTIPIRVIHTDEALTIVRETQKVLNNQ